MAEIKEKTVRVTVAPGRTVYLSSEAGMTTRKAKIGVNQDGKEIFENQVLAHDKRHARPGETVEVSEADAKRLIETGFAVAAN